MSKYVERSGLRNVKLITENQRTVTNEDGTITVHIPISFKRHGGRKYIITPQGIPDQYALPKGKESLLKAIGRAFAWQTMLDSDAALTHDDIAETANLPRSYVSRVMRATLLAPDIIEAILDGRQLKHMTLTDLTRMPSDWNEQREYFGCI